MPPQKGGRRGNPYAKGAPVTINLKGMTRQQLNKYKNMMEKESKRFTMARVEEMANRKGQNIAEMEESKDREEMDLSEHQNNANENRSSNEEEFNLLKEVNENEISEDEKEIVWDIRDM